MSCRCIGWTSVFEGENGQIIALVLIYVPSHKITQQLVLSNTKLGPSWMDPIVEFLRPDILPEGKREAHKLRIRAVLFWISLTGDLYKRSYLWPHLLCVQPSLVEDVPFEINEGMCGLHSGRISLAHRALAQGY